MSSVVFLDEVAVTWASKGITVCWPIADLIRGVCWPGHFLHNCAKMQERIMDELRVAEVAKALANPVRVRILSILEGGERCGCEFVPLLGLDPSVVSRHLATLQRAGLVESRRDGVRVLWRLANPEIPRLLKCLEALACAEVPT